MSGLTVLSLIDLRPRRLGGFEEYFLALSESLTSRGHGSVLGFPELPPPWLHERFVGAGADIECVDIRSSLVSRIRSIRSVIRKRQVDILHGTFLNIFSLDTILMKRLGIRTLILSDQISRTPYARSWLKDRLVRAKNRLVCRSVDRIVADAEYVRRDLIEKSSADPRKIEVLYNGVNTARFNTGRHLAVTRESLGIPRDHLVVSTVANCIRWKGLDIFLRMARQVLDSGAEVTFVHVGDGPLLSEFEALASSLGITASMRFLGLRDDVDAIMGISDVFVLCSLWEEAFALVLLEAMASVVPVVASRIGAIPESILDGTTGLLFPAGDSQAAAAAVLRLLGDRQLRSKLGTAGRQRVVDHFTVQQWAEKTVDLYEEIAGP